MKNSGLIIALGLIGYGLYKFTQSGGSTSTGLGSPFRSSGTAKVPSVLGAAKPGNAPVTNGGFSSAQPPSGGTNILPLIQGGIAAAESLYKFVREIVHPNARNTPVAFIPGDGPQGGTSFGSVATEGDGGRFGPSGGFTPHEGPALFDFNKDLNLDPAPVGGFDDYYPDDVGSIA